MCVCVLGGGGGGVDFSKAESGKKNSQYFKFYLSSTGNIFI